MYLISLIIPIYNAEHVLDETINSIINQSIGFDNIELILIDDNSKDNSKKIIEKYSKTYENIIPYYSNKNHGYPGFGRNIGLKLSTAKFIMFMDNDDRLDENICRKLYSEIIKEDVDIVCCNKISVDNIGEIKKDITFNDGIIKNNQITITDDEILLFDNISVWNKIFKKQIIYENNLKFLENTSADDFAFSISYFLKAKKMIYLKDYYGYYWNIKSDSLSHVVTREQIEELLTTYKHIYNELKNENKEKFFEKIIRKHLTYLLTQCSWLKLNTHEFEEVLKEIFEFENQVNFSSKLDENWADIINKFILNKKFKIAITCLRFLNLVRKSNFLRKINRKIN